jgi:hypothetical protein
VTADLATSELEARLRDAESIAASKLAALPTVPNKAMALMTLNAKYGTVAWNAVALGRSEVARKAFGQVASCLLELTGQDPVEATGADRRGLLEFSLLSGNKELEARVVSSPLASRYPDLGPNADGYMRALYALAKGEDAEARAAALALAAIPEDRAKKGKYYPGLGPVVEAVLQKSEEALGAALGVVLETHVQFAKVGHLRGLETAYFCMPATCLALLARRRGLTASVDPRYSKVPIKLRVTSLTEWEGKPTKGLMFEVKVDSTVTRVVS